MCSMLTRSNVYRHVNASVVAEYLYGSYMVEDIRYNIKLANNKK